MLVPTYRGRRYGTWSEAESLSGSFECSSRHSKPTHEEIDARIQSQVETRFAQQEQLWRAQMENMSTAFMSIMRQVQSSNSSVPMPDISALHTPTPVAKNC
ncbi:unnamed protein product, partial [Cuscuta epithymum]